MIIDSHVHIGDSLSFSLPEEDVLFSMKKYSVDKIIVSNVESSECDFDGKIIPKSVQIPQIKSLKKTVDFAKKNKNKVFAALWVKPLTEFPDDEFIKLIENNLDVVKAIKFHPYHSALFFDDEKIIKFVDVAKQFHLPVITHTSCNVFDNCDLVYKVSKMYPEVNFIMAHLGLMTDNLHAIDLCSKQKNLYGDTAWVPFENACKFIEKCGSEKLFFGTDNPIDGKDTYSKNKKGETSIYVDYFNNKDDKLKSVDYENLMYKNAERFFRI